MLADILTKVLVGTHFRSQVEGLGVVWTVFHILLVFS
jgi:hypothetical protein